MADTRNLGVMVNDEAEDQTRTLAAGEEALDGSGNPLPTVTRSAADPTASDLRPAGHWWFNTTALTMWWSQSPGSWHRSGEYEPPTPPVLVDSLPDFYDDFVNGIQAGLGWTIAAVGGSAAFTSVAPPAGATGRTAVMGVVSANIGTSTTGRVGAILGASLLRFEGGKYEVWMRVNVPVLSTAVEDFRFRIGFLDNNTNTEPTDGAYIEYNRAADAVNWRAVTANSGTRTTAALTPVVANKWVDFSVRVSVSPTLKAEFFVDDVLTATILTNIPTAAGRETSVGLVAYKTAGGTARSVYADRIFAKRS